MTDEQFRRAVEIAERIKELNDVKKEIKGTSEHRLTYSCKGQSGWMLCNSYVLWRIGGILDKHDDMIRREIDEEIAALEAEIKEL